MKEVTVFKILTLLLAVGLFVISHKWIDEEAWRKSETSVIQTIHDYHPEIMTDHWHTSISISRDTSSWFSDSLDTLPVESLLVHFKANSRVTKHKGD